MSSSPKWECDVFVSFKSSNPVDTFTSDLFKRLDQVGIRYFRDDNGEKVPKDFKGKRDEALKQVRFALVVFCESYVKSKCHDGLVELLKRKKDPKLVVIPICFTDGAVVPPTFAEDLGTNAGKISSYVLRTNKAKELKELIDKIVERLVNEILSQSTKKVFGPFGGKDEKSWCSREIKDGISAAYNMDGIKSITFEVNNGADTRQQYGTNGKDSTYEVKFEKEEYITSFAGYFDNVKKRITWLTFRTSNGRTLGPFGKIKEEYFYVPSKGGKVIEFFLGGKDFLTSIGARVQQDSEKFRPVVVRRMGLIGKRSGSKWDDGHHHANVTKIIVNPDSSGVQSIKFEYAEKKAGEFWQSETHGLKDGNNSPAQEILVGENEHLTSISAVCEGDCIKSLKFWTDKNVIKKIGATSSTAARSNRENEKALVPNGKIVGFYGWWDGRLYGIGAYFEREPIRGADRWDDKKYFGVREICLWLDKTDYTRIYGIQFVYDDGSEKGETVHHGNITAGGSCEEKEVKLDYPWEYLTSISGCTQEDDAIKSLTFHSNRKTHYFGPSVGDEGRFFWYPSKGSRITAFYGTFDNKTLKSLGVYAETIPHISPFKTIGPFGGTDGVEWDDGVHSDVRAFRVGLSKEGDVLHSISFMYDDNGSLVEGPQRGGGDVDKWIWLDFPNERLNSITVWKVKKEKETIVSHLKITTTVDSYGPYPIERKGKGKGKPDEIKLDGDSIENGLRDGDGNERLRYNRIGFFGRAGKSYLNAIGAHFEQN